MIAPDGLRRLLCDFIGRRRWFTIVPADRIADAAALLEMAGADYLFAKLTGGPAAFLVCDADPAAPLRGVIPPGVECNEVAVEVVITAVCQTVSRAGDDYGVISLSEGWAKIART